MTGILESRNTANNYQDVNLILFQVGTLLSISYPSQRHPLRFSNPSSHHREFSSCNLLLYRGQWSEDVVKAGRSNRPAQDQRVSSQAQ